MNTICNSKIREIFSPVYYRVWDKGYEFTLCLVKKIIDRTSITERLTGNLVSIRELISKLNFVDESFVTLEWLLNFAVDGGLLVRENNDTNTYYSISEHCDTSKFYKNEELIEREILAMDPTWKVFVELTKLIAGDYALFLRGEKRGLDILFARDRINYWNDYFCNKFNGYTAFNLLGAQSVISILNDHTNSKILEIGAGTGGATEKLVFLLKAVSLIKKIEAYVFSDISPIFLRYGNRILTSIIGDEFFYDTRKLDFNFPLTEQNIDKESYDIIYGVNALHVSKNLLNSVKYIYEVLKPGGSLVVCEYVRPVNGFPLYMEIIFSMLDSYTNVATEEACRSTYGFLTISNWYRVFNTAGFNKIESIDDSLGVDNFKRDKMAMVMRGIK